MQSIIDEAKNAIEIPISCIVGVRNTSNVIIVLKPNNLEIKTLLLFSFDNNFDVWIWLIDAGITNQKTRSITAVPRSAIPNALKFCIMPGLLSFKKNHFKFSYSFPSLTTDTNEKSNTDVINNTIAIRKDPAPIKVKFVLRLPTCV